MRRYEHAPRLGKGKAQASADKALFSAQAWILCPCQEHATRCYRDAAAVRSQERAHHRFWAAKATEVVGIAGSGEEGAALAQILSALNKPVRPCGVSALKEELLPWALGAGDPVLDRVEARRAKAKKKKARREARRKAKKTKAKKTKAKKKAKKTKAKRN